MDHQYLYNDQAVVLAIETLENGRYRVVLDQTIFYPQGGGQPYDQGTITTQDSGALFDVHEVRFDNGVVYHIGEFKTGSFAIQQKVNLAVYQARRSLHNKYHAGGNLCYIAMLHDRFNI